MRIQEESRGTSCVDRWRDQIGQLSEATREWRADTATIRGYAQQHVEDTPWPIRHIPGIRTQYQIFVAAERMRNRGDLLYHPLHAPLSLVAASVFAHRLALVLLNQGQDVPSVLMGIVGVAGSLINAGVHMHARRVLAVKQMRIPNG